MTASFARKGMSTVAVVVAVVAVIVVAAFGITLLHSPPASSGTQSTSPATGAIAAQGPCASHTPSNPIFSSPGGTGGRGIAYQLTNGSMSKIAFIMLPGTTGTICVTYGINVVNDAPLPNSSVFRAEVDKVSASKGTNGYDFSYSPAPGMSITSNASSIQSFVPRTHSDEVTIVYTITTSSSATGVFDFAYPFGCPPLTPLAVLGAGQTLNPSDFPGFFWPADCVQDTRVSSGVITGYGSITATWVTGYSGITPPWISK